MWKLTRKNKKIELFDLRDDLSETKNLADQKPDVVKQLTTMMEKFDTELKANSRPVGKVEVKKEA